MGIEFFFLFAIVAFLGEFTRQEIQIFVSLARSIDPIHCLKCEIMRSWHTNAIVCAYASACVYFICTWNYNIVSNPNIYMLVYWNIGFFSVIHLIWFHINYSALIPIFGRVVGVGMVWCVSHMWWAHIFPTSMGKIIWKYDDSTNFHQYSTDIAWDNGIIYSSEMISMKR